MTMEWRSAFTLKSVLIARCAVTRTVVDDTP